MTHRFLLSALLAAAGATLVAPVRADEPAALTAKEEACLACHGANGISENAGVPSLAGQPDLFVQWQLVFYRSGRLKSESMVPVAAELSDEDVRSIGAFIAALPTAMPAPAADDKPEMTATGAKLAVERHCVSCHGANFGGQQAAARLAGQREEVLLKALHDYKTGARTGTGIAAMPEIAYQLSEDDMAALAHYLTRLR